MVTSQRLTPELWADLQRINKEVNDSNVSDPAAEKIKRLTNTRWGSSLAVATCYIEDNRGRIGRGERHSVVIVRTDRGYLILDTRRDSIRPPENLPYKWIEIGDLTYKRWQKTR